MNKDYQYTNVTGETDRTGQTGQRSDRIGRTVLQTVAPKMKKSQAALKQVICSLTEIETETEIDIISLPAF